MDKKFPEDDSQIIWDTGPLRSWAACEMDEENFGSLFPPKSFVGNFYVLLQ